MPSRERPFRRRRPGEPVSVASVGRLIAIKDPATVVAAFRRAARPDDQLVMVGDGELRKSLELDVRMFPGVGGIFFTGLVPRDEVHETLHCADVFVSASTVEGLPVAVLEAMACRCLVVLSDIPAHREIASHASSVQLVEPGDVDGFARAIDRVAAMSPAARLRAGEALRGCVIQHYSVRQMSEAYGRVYESLGRGRPARGRARPAVASSTVRRVAYAGTCALLGAGAAFGYARLHPPSFEAGVTLSVGDSSELLTADVLADRTGSAADIANLVDRQPVLQPVAERLGVDNWRSLRARIETITDSEDPLLIHVTASAGSAGRAEQLVTAVADELVSVTGEGAGAELDRAFAEHELARIPVEIAAAQEELASLSLSAAEQDAGDVVARDRRESRLRALLSALHTGEKSILEWRSEAGEIRGLVVTDRTAGREAPPLPEPRVLAVAGAAAGACLWLAGWLLLRRETEGEPR